MPTANQSLSDFRGDHLSVKMFANGATIGTAAIQAAINASSGRALAFPAGTYVATGLTWGTSDNILLVIHPGADLTGCTLPTPDATHRIRDERMYSTDWDDGHTSQAGAMEVYTEVRTRPLPGAPLGADMRVRARGPADLYLLTTPLRLISQTAVAAPGEVTIEVAADPATPTWDALKLYVLGAALTVIDPADPEQNEVILAANYSAVDATHITATFANAHPSGFVVRQSGAIGILGHSIFCHGDVDYDGVMLRDTNGVPSITLPKDTSATTWPENAVRVRAIVTGDGDQGDLVLRLNNVLSRVRVVNYENTANVVEVGNERVTAYQPLALSSLYGSVIRVLGDPGVAPAVTHLALADDNGTQYLILPSNTANDFPECAIRVAALLAGEAGANKDLRFRVGSATGSIQAIKSDNTGYLFVLDDNSMVFQTAVELEGDFTLSPLGGGGNRVLTVDNDGVVGAADIPTWHEQNTDTILDEGGANEVSAAEAKAAYTHSQADHAGCATLSAEGSLGSLTQTPTDITGATVTLDRDGVWLISASVTSDSDLTDGAVRSKLVCGGVDQSGSISSGVSGTGTTGLLVTGSRAWIYEGTNGDVCKLQAWRSSASGSGSIAGANITAVWLRA